MRALIVCIVVPIAFVVAALTTFSCAADPVSGPSLAAATPTTIQPADPAAVPAADRQARIDAFLRYLDSRGITLVEKDRWWRVVRPRSEGYTVLVSLRVFPQTATEPEMRRELSQINLAYLLNSRARLAMSYPSAEGPLPRDTRLQDIPVIRALQQAFEDYAVGGEAR